MTNHHKHTPGLVDWSNEYKTCDDRPTLSLVSDAGYGILSCDGLPNSPNKDNANFIKEAFNVTHETGLSPRRLLAERNELLHALIYLRDRCRLYGGKNGGKMDLSKINATIDKVSPKTKQVQG